MLEEKEQDTRALQTHGHILLVTCVINIRAWLLMYELCPNWLIPSEHYIFWHSLQLDTYAPLSLGTLSPIQGLLPTLLQTPWLKAIFLYTVVWQLKAIHFQVNKLLQRSTNDIWNFASLQLKSRYHYQLTRMFYRSGFLFEFHSRGHQFHKLMLSAPVCNALLCYNSVTEVFWLLSCRIVMDGGRNNVGQKRKKIGLQRLIQCEALNLQSNE